MQFPVYWQLVKFGFRLLYNEMAWTYDTVSWVVSLGEWRTWQRAALRHLHVKPGCRVLELAHGTANLQIDLRTAGLDSVAIDFSPAMGRIAHRKLTRNRIPPQLARARAQAIPFPSHTFPAVVSTFPTEFIVDPATLAEVYRVLQPGGRLVFVPSGTLTGGGFAAQGLEAAYRVTGQRGPWPVNFEDRFTAAGFRVSQMTEPCRISVAQVVVAEKMGEVRMEILMHRFRLLLILLGSLIAAGCSTAAPIGIALTVPPMSAPPATIAATATPVQQATQPTLTGTALPAQAATEPARKGGAADHAAGPEEAYLTITMYGDFQCAPCIDIARSLAVLRGRYPNDVRVVWRHFPQKADDKAKLAAQAAEAASAQGKFWEMHDQLFVSQPEWRGLPPDKFRAKLTEYAKLIGVPNVAAFDAALDQQVYAPLVDKAVQQALDLDFKGVPVLLFNGLPYSGRIDEYGLDAHTRLRLLEKRWYKQQPYLQIDRNKHYTATLVTEKGNIVVELYTQAAIVTVNNFVFLARGGWYNDITFHRVIPGQIAQTGDPSGTGFGTAGYNIVDENDNGLSFDREGVVAMASTRGVPNSGSCQFFITYGPLVPAIDYDKQFTIFGHVTQGMDVLRKLTPRDPFDEQRYPNPPPGDKLIRVEITEG